MTKPVPRTWSAPFCLLLVCLLLATASCHRAAPVDLTAYRAEMDEWHAQRDASLRKKDGWLTLVGLFWLGEGENTFGSDPTHQLVFPPGKVPGKIGSFRRTGSDVTLVLEPGMGLAANGEPITVTEMPLASDHAGPPTKLTLGSLTFHLITRGERIGVRLRDAESPVLAGFTGVESFELAPAWRIRARFEPYDPPKKITIPNVLGASTEEDCPGAIVFEHEGATHRLEPTGDAKEGLSLVFGDATNGRETYGGGRFLEVPAPVNGVVDLDFNKAYNPPCVFTPYATCPLPPRQNRLPIAIPAGEKVYGHPAEHALPASS